MRSFIQYFQQQWSYKKSFTALHSLQSLADCFDLDILLERFSCKNIENSSDDKLCKKVPLCFSYGWEQEQGNRSCSPDSLEDDCFDQLRKNIKQKKVISHRETPSECISIINYNEGSIAPVVGTERSLEWSRNSTRLLTLCIAWSTLFQNSDVFLALMQWLRVHLLSTPPNAPFRVVAFYRKSRQLIVRISLQLPNVSNLKYWIRIESFGWFC